MRGIGGHWYISDASVVGHWVRLIKYPTTKIRDYERRYAEMPGYPLGKSGKRPGETRTQANDTWFYGISPHKMRVQSAYEWLGGSGVVQTR